MTLCPVAIVVGCRKCPAFTACPLKSVIGDYKKPDETQSTQHGEKAQTGAKMKNRTRRVRKECSRSEAGQTPSICALQRIGVR